eukprot:XP_011679432.1 PREDICTED: angiopoietin-1 receptor-like [Strongylocentrotus purpuratus]
MVGFSVGYRSSDMHPRVQYQCYRSTVDLDATLEFGRYISTRSNETELPSLMSHSKKQAAVKVIRFKGKLRDQAYGVFYCRGSKVDRDPTPVLSFFIRSDAKFVPVADAFTRTVNVGELDVEIAMTAIRPSETPGSVTHWRFNGSEPVKSQNNRTAYLIDGPVTVEDEGIYEVYYERERDRAQGGFFRLIVRACPPNRWGPPDCEGVCDKCYNGGVCDDKSGMCICPNGFMGPNCLTICRLGGGNRFGLNCEFRCSYKSDLSQQCRGALFCLPDPFGCSCDIGSKGLTCMVACFDGEFGAGCTERCHCASGECGIYTGECLGLQLGCSPGWSGENCQIPDDCDADYYGEDCTLKCHCLNDAPCHKATGACSNRLCARNYATYDGTPECQACKGLSYGFNCSHECHCDKDACDLKMGRCNGKCLKNWLPPDCIRGVSRLTSNPKVNPGQPSNVTCHAVGNPSPRFDTVYLTSDLGKSSSSGKGIVSRSVTVTGTVTDPETIFVFDIAAVEKRELFSCTLAEDSRTAILAVWSRTYELPVISKPLEVLHIGTHEIAVRWDAWRPGVDEGEPPLTEYIVVYHNTTSTGDWTEAVSVAPDQNLTAVVTGMRSDTTYEFAIAGVRVGPGGIGLPGPAIRVSTHCERPNVRSFDLTIVSTSSHQIELSWKKPPVSEARCQSGFQAFTISYSKRDSPENETQVAVPFDAPPRYTIPDLELCTEYAIHMAASNKDSDSELSDKVHAKTTDEVVSAPKDVRVTGVTPSTVTLQWSILNFTQPCLDIRGYEILYRRTYPRPEKMGKVIAVDSNKKEIEYPIKNLWQKTNFSIQVRVINEAGKGPWSHEVSAQTLVHRQHHQEQRLVDTPDQIVDEIPASSSDQRKTPGHLPGILTGVGLVLIALLIASVLVYRRRRRKIQTVEPVDSFKSLDVQE